VIVFIVDWMIFAVSCIIVLLVLPFVHLGTVVVFYCCHAGFIPNSFTVFWLGPNLIMQGVKTSVLGFLVMVFIDLIGCVLSFRGGELNWEMLGVETIVFLRV